MERNEKVATGESVTADCEILLFCWGTIVIEPDTSALEFQISQLRRAIELSSLSPDERAAYLQAEQEQVRQA